MFADAPPHNLSFPHPPPDDPLRDGRAAHRDRARSDPTGVRHRDVPGPAAGGLQGEHPPRGLGHRCGLPPGVVHITRLFVHQDFASTRLLAATQTPWTAPSGTDATRSQRSSPSSLQTSSQRGVPATWLSQRSWRGSCRQRRRRRWRTERAARTSKVPSEIKKKTVQTSDQ